MGACRVGVVIAVVWIVLALWCRFPGFGLPYGLASLLSGGLCVEFLVWVSLEIGCVVR